MCRAIFVLLLSLASASAGLCRLDAISMIESGDNDSAIGGAGEISRYQIKPSVWHLLTPLNDYNDQQVSSRVAARYLAFLESSFLKQTGRLPDDFDSYVLWNAGLSYYKRIGFSAERVSPVIRERAERFVNLCHMSSTVGPRASKPPILAAE